MKQSKQTLLAFCWEMTRPQKTLFFLIFLVPLLWSFDATLWPYLIRVIVDILTGYETQRAAVVSALVVPVIWGLVLWVVIDLSFRFQGILLSRALPRLEANIRMHMFDHVQRHSPQYFNKHFSGGLANKISDMTTQVTTIITQLLWMFIPAVATCLVSLIFFFKISPLFSLLFLFLLISYGIVCWLFTKKCEELEASHGESRTHLMGRIVDSLSNNFAVNLFFRFHYEKSYLSRFQADEEKKNRAAKTYVEWMRLWLSATFLIGGVAINAFMIRFWILDKISTGEVVQIFNMTWNIIMILWMAGTAIPSLFQAIGIAKQALAVMHDPQDVLDLPQAEPLVVSKGEIVFEDVSFRFGKKELFKNKHVHIRGGEKIGLVGFSGAGKSTFVNLIMRFFAVDSGRILIDGQEIAKVTLESLRRQVALIPQDPILFHRTIEENIRYGSLQASQEQLEQAAKLSHCDRFIQKSAEGYQRAAGERGTHLSGGERQRIAIARVILANSPILIFDEATSALDSMTEKYIQDSLEKLMEHRTTIVIAHRLSTLAKMDRILVFDHGKIVEEGSHEQLMTQKGCYFSMWRMQARGFLPEGPQLRS